ncbi:MAG: magnesium chelatase [Sphingobacteriia bacterium]
MSTLALEKIQSLGQLKAAGYQPKSVKQELRDNLVQALKAGQDPFRGILGYEDSVIPELQTAILSRHNILLLGLRGQAKTRIARQLVQLLDPYIPIVAGSEIQDDPFRPLSRFAIDTVHEAGEDTPIDWLHRDQRYVEKLATPDVSVADLIGDLDPIKAATLKLSYADERAIHFGLIPRAQRCLFVINELPDLQPRIQVALFNILQEQDIQIRGFRLRFPLDVQFVFTANPEDYTNRGSIVTPLKDRIESQILTHYPESVDVATAITRQEARTLPEQRTRAHVPELVARLLELVAFEARDSEYVDAHSGVSARLTISGMEQLHSAVELRLLQNGQAQDHARIGDLYSVIPAITGKIELVYEGEQEGPAAVAHALIGKAIRRQFNELYPNPERLKKEKESNVYEAVIQWFNSGQQLDLTRTQTHGDYAAALQRVPGLAQLVEHHHPGLEAQTRNLHMERILHGLSEQSQISRHRLARGVQFTDMLGSLFSTDFSFDDEEEDDEA